MTTGDFKGRLGIIQRVLPVYRTPFFNLLAEHCQALSIFTGQPRTDEAILNAKQLQTAEVIITRNFHFLTTSSRFYFCYQAGLEKWLDSWNPDAMIIEANFRYLSSASGIRWMKKRNRPVIGWGLGAPLDRGMLSGLRTQFLGQFDALIAYSKRGAEQYADCGFPKEKIFVAPNSAAPAPIEPLPERSITNNKQPVLLFVGRLQARKRIPALLKACSRLAPAYSPRLVIVGDGPEINTLRKIADEIYPAAEFTGEKHGSELEPYFLSADLFVLPGTGGLAVQQAMTWGLPVIVAQGDGTQDDLVRPGNGWQIQPDDDESLFLALQEALGDIPRLRVMGAESYRIVSEEINLETMKDVFLQVLNRFR